MAGKRQCSRAFSHHLKLVYYAKIVIRNPENLVAVGFIAFRIWFIVIRRPLRHTEDTQKVKRLHWWQAKPDSRLSPQDIFIKKDRRESAGTYLNEKGM